MMWNDDDALADWVGQQLPQPPRDWLVMPWHEWWGAPFTQQDREREAVDEARKGNFKLLAALMQQNVSLSKQARALVADRLLGGKAKTRGRPRQTVTQRRVRNPIHDAAALVPIIEKFLRQHFPKQRGYRDRAIDVAAHLAGLDRDRLANDRAFKRRSRPK
jgi:Asp-tRNA(Asn)/Glu-tRNA(Gln) amidotransferase B subunit